MALPGSILGSDPAAVRRARSRAVPPHEEARLSRIEAQAGTIAVPRLGARACLWIFALALIARLAATAVVGFSTVRFADAPAYLRAAGVLAETGQYPLRTDPYYFRPPGYSAFLTLVTLGHPERIAVAKLANVLLGAFSVLLLAGLAARLFRSRAVAIGAGLAAALDPSLIFVSSDVQTEPLFLLLLLAAGFLLLVAVDRPSSNFAVLAGVLLGLGCLARPSALAVAPFLLAPLADRRYPVRARAHLAGSALLGFVLSLAPWVVRNALVYREFIPVSDVGGLNVYLGNTDEMLRFFDLRTRAEYAAWAAETDRVTRARIAELQAEGITSPAAISRALVKRTLSDTVAHPGMHARLLLLKSWDWLRPYPNPLFWPRLVVVGVGFLYACLYALAAFGLAKAPRRGASLFALGILVASMAAHVASVVSWRYRVPYWDPILLLYAVYGVSRLR